MNVAGAIRAAEMKEAAVRPPGPRAGAVSARSPVNSRHQVWQQRSREVTVAQVAPPGTVVPPTAQEPRPGVRRSGLGTDLHRQDDSPRALQAPASNTLGTSVPQ